LLTGTAGAGSGPEKTNNCGVLSSHTQWYATVAGASGPITVGTVGSSNVNQLAVYTGNSFASLAYVGCATNRPARVTFNGTNGMVYWFALDPGTNAVSNLGLAYGFAPAIENYGVGNGSFSLQSGVAPPIAYQLLATTNPALNLSNWSVVLTTNWNLNNPNYFNYRLNYFETNHFPQRFYLLQPVQ